MMKGKLKILSVMIAFAVICSSCSEKRDTISDYQKQTVESQNSAKVGEASTTEQTKEQMVATLVREMSIEEKAGQMVQGSRDLVTDDELTHLGLGSVLSGGGSYPGGNSLKEWKDMILGYQSAAMESEHQIPILYGVDAVHGLALVQDAVVYPHNISIGAANDKELTFQMGAAVAEEMKLAGILWNFSPCVAVSTDPRWGRTYECYSSDPSIVTALAEAYAKGQADRGVAATAKHYVADGGTAYGSGLYELVDEGDAQITEEELRAKHLVPYEALVNAGVPIIMASFSSFNGKSMHENKYLLTDVLKKELGFKGFVVSDWEAVKRLSGSNYEENVALAVNAGVDMLMEPNDYARSVDTIVSCIKKGSISPDRIDDAVSRILTVKYDMGLFDDPYMQKMTHEVTALGSPEYRNLAKQLVEKSLVLLKNEKNVLPLKRGQKIFVTGPAIDDIGLQCGGWGLTWQGQTDENSGRLVNGTSILEGLEAYAKEYDLEIITDRKHAEEADAVILGIGEIPYAEYQGDTADLSITGALAHPDNKEVIDYVKTLNKPVVTLIVAGRNVLIDQYSEDWDSIVMCYLPGSEGEGIAPVLVGETPFTGKLPMPYYKSLDDIGDDEAELLYPLGYGLTY